MSLNLLNIGKIDILFISQNLYINRELSCPWQPLELQAQRKPARQDFFLINLMIREIIYLFIFISYSDLDLCTQ